MGVLPVSEIPQQETDGRAGSRAAPSDGSEEPGVFASSRNGWTRGRRCAEMTLTGRTKVVKQMPMPSEQEMRAAIAARDKTYDDRFFYAVVTTGVFCRPSCAARPARPENLRFFRDTDSALAAGFRPCKRCRPTDTQPGLTQLVGVARFIEAHAEERLTLDGLAKRVALSPSRFQRVFKAAFGVSPKAYQDAVRMKRFKAALKEGDDITGAIFSAGFGSISRVYGERARNIGMTPKGLPRRWRGRDDRNRMEKHGARHRTHGSHRTGCVLRAVREGQGDPSRAVTR